MLGQNTVQSSYINSTQKAKNMTEKETKWVIGDILSVTQASEYLNVSRQRVHFYIKDSRFPNAYQVGVQWNIPFEDILNLEIKDVGRPPETES